MLIRPEGLNEYEYIPMVAEEEMLFSYDELGPERIVRVLEKGTRDVRAIWVKDNSWIGLPCVGGTFYQNWPWQTVEEVCRLKARWMSWKNALVHCSGSYPAFGEKDEPLHWGGSKIGIVGDPKSPEKHAVIRGVALALFEAGIIPQEHLFGLDENVNEKDSAEVIKFLGSPRYVAGCGKEFGGVPFDELGITGMAAADGVAETLALLNMPIWGCRVAVQGYGAVGQAFVRRAINLGMHVVAISDLRMAPSHIVANQKGLWRSQFEKKDGNIYYHGAADKLDKGHQDIRFFDCDVLVLAATGNVITTEDEAGRVKARIIAEPANFPTTKPVQDYFHRAGKIVAPGPALNAGGVISAYAEQALWDIMSADEKIAIAKHEATYSVRTVTRKVLEQARADNQPPYAIVEEMARKRLNAFRKT